MEVLKQKGGEYLTEYMAKTTEEAKLMFRPLNKPHRPKPGKQPPNSPPGQLTPPPPRTDHGPYAPGIKPESSYLASNDLIKIFRQFAKIQRKCGMTVAKVPENIILSGETYGRKKRQSNSGSVTTNGSCVYRGTSDDGYLQMCTTCSTTTTLSDSYFPRVLNEVSCGDSLSSTSSSANDNGCLFVSGTANGQCRQQYIYVNMLRKTGKCSLVTNSDGNAVAVDEWELYTQPIHVSCECMVDERSFLSNFVTT
ncbi:uncharacterized skeletal organic matrix protein 8-like [Lingula anatina]|uniref:Uncharacterized skeletal organic matrix protein 8-like n=1 Tax=Lingula anatina TaxID=7574 RepID=A0A1S3HAR1_LINAN|nr:uncharacterized skeletal organic matrix protein 8-like [Lingula anatina]|eukprot:XP_013383170.1 uncharacterized skeletal organic matrix protein 8-like [Lingula anatina]